MKRLTMLLVLFVASCATTDAGRQQQLQIAADAIRDQVTILRPLMDDETAAYVTLAVETMDIIAQGGGVNWETTMAALDELQPQVQVLLERSMSPEEAAVVIVSFRSALRTAQILTVE